MSSTKFLFSGRSEKQNGGTSFWLAETFSTSPLRPMNGILRTLTGSKILTSSIQFLFFRPMRKQKWPPWLICKKDDTLTHVHDMWPFLVHLSRRLKCTTCIVIMCCPSSVRRLSSSTFHIFDFSSKTAEQNSRKLDRKRKSQRPPPSLCFSSRSEKQDGRPGLWLAETFSTSPLKPLNGIQRNIVGSKISTSSTKFVFFGPIGKTRWPPWPLIGWDIFDFSVETAEQNSMKLDRKQDLNVLYQVCVFRADRKNKMAALASDWLRHFRILLRNRWTEFNET